MTVSHYQGHIDYNISTHTLTWSVTRCDAGVDFENEFQMALINHKINPELDTMFLTASSQYMYLSSSLVKELGSYNADLKDFIPEEIIPDFRRRLEEQNQSRK